MIAGIVAEYQSDPESINIARIYLWENRPRYIYNGFSMCNGSILKIINWRKRDILFTRQTSSNFLGICISFANNAAIHYTHKAVISVVSWLPRDLKGKSSVAFADQRGDKVDLLPTALLTESDFFASQSYSHWYCFMRNIDKWTKWPWDSHAGAIFQ